MTSILLQLRRISILLIILLCATTIAQAAQNDPPMNPIDIQTRLSHRGVGKKVKITEVDGSVVKGTIYSIDANSFRITPKDATHPALIRYSQVAFVSRTGLSTAGKVALGVGSGVGALIAYSAMSLH